MMAFKIWVAPAALAILAARLVGFGEVEDRKFCVALGIETVVFIGYTLWLIWNA